MKSVRVVGKVVGLVVFGLLGLGVGAAGPFIGREVLRWQGPSVPYGIVLALVATAGLFYTGGKLFGPLGAVIPVLTWAVPVVAFLLPRPEGDVVLANDGYGTAFLLVGVLIAAWNFGRALTNPGKVDRRAAERS
ncbi:DUF6113 family protein [Tenggerimyces flavus]|uniref:DUF6113 family protein n=1 Tax=Tenggerimyces flavus TaxID=1708749 RepID=A0ABV7YGK5_9ACTN|nr:DUF6113 family protein [Tenggerimyces flavus]MBM7790949.1 hypothetical protein [Tenggerimyces flavus]